MRPIDMRRKHCYAASCIRCTSGKVRDMGRNDQDNNERDHELPYQISVRTVSNLYSITLSESVEGVYKYAELNSALREDVTAEDVVNLHLSNYGGSVDTAAALVNAIRDCKGLVRGIVNSPCFSAATILALACDELEIRPFSYLMFHNFSTQIAGKSGELKSRLPADVRHVETMMRSIYSPFLTKKEIDAVFDDKDVYVHWDEKDIADRLARHHAAKQEASS